MRIITNRIGPASELFHRFLAPIAAIALTLAAIGTVILWTVDGADSTQRGGRAPALLKGVDAGQVVHQIITVQVKPNVSDPIRVTTEEYYILVGSNGRTDKAYVKTTEAGGTATQEGYYDAASGTLYNYTTGAGERDRLVLSSAGPDFSPFISWSDSDIAEAIAQGFTAQPSVTLSRPTVVLEKNESNATTDKRVKQVVATDLGIEIGTETALQSTSGSLIGLYSRSTSLLEVIPLGAVLDGIFNWEPPKDVTANR